MNFKAFLQSLLGNQIFFQNETLKKLENSKNFQEKFACTALELYQITQEKIEQDSTPALLSESSEPTPEAGEPPSRQKALDEIQKILEEKKTWEETSSFPPKNTGEEMPLTKKEKTPSSVIQSAPPSSFTFYSEDRYTVLETLGKGGMGVVQLVRDRLLGREVAQKQIKLETKKQLSQYQKQMLWRLYQEAKITAILEHPNIVPLYDMQQGQDKKLYFTMRRIEGKTFLELLKDPSVTTETLLDIFNKMCDAVSYAHSKGIIHRDLKPENIMVGSFGEVYVVDWGIAKTANGNFIEIPEEWSEIFSRQDDFLKTAGGVGTFGYVAPEQNKQASTSFPQSDIYALGKILKQCFTRRSPYDEFYELQMKLKIRKIEDLPPELSKKTAIVPEDILAIIRKATRDQWEDRYRSVKEMMQDIERYRRHFRVSVRDYKFSELFWKWSQRNRPLLLLGGIGFMFLCGSLGYLQWFRLQEQHVRFLKAYEQAKQELLLAEKKESPAEKIPSLLNALNSFNLALTIKHGFLETQQYKLRVGRQLIHFACKTKDYQLAKYVWGNLKEDTYISITEKRALAQWIKTQENATLTQHLNRLQYWIETLNKTPLQEGMVEDAIFELSRMTEPEIYQKLIEFLEKGTEYFLQEQSRNSRGDEFYQVIVHVLGRLGNPKAAHPLSKALMDIANKIASSTIESSVEMNYLVALAQALGRLHVKGTASVFESVRYTLRKDIFWQRVRTIYLELLALESLEARPTTNAQECYHRGMAYYELGLYDEAIRDFTLALRYAPEFADLYHNRALAKENKGDLVGAREDYESSLKKDPSLVNAHINLGKLFKESQNTEKAIEHYSKAIELEPSNAIVYLNRGVLMAEIGKKKQAHYDFQKAVQLQPQNALAYAFLGDFYLQEKLWEEAIKSYTQSIQQDPEKAQSFYRRGYAYQNQNNFTKALEDYQKAIQLDPQHTEAYLHRGTIRYWMKDFKGALADLNQLIKIKPLYPEAYTNRGAVKLELNDYIGAIEDQTQALTLEPSAYAYSNRAMAKRRLKDLEGALSDYAEALKYESNPIIHFNRGNLYNDLGKFSESIAEYEEALKLDPNWIPAWKGIADRFIRIKEFEKAWKTLNDGYLRTKDIQLLSSFLELCITLAVQKYRQKELEVAKNYLLKFLEYAPENHTEYQKVTQMLDRIENSIKK